MQTTTQPPQPATAPVAEQPSGTIAAGGSAFRIFYEKRYMLLVAIGGNGIFYTQAFVIFYNRTAKDVSALAFSISAWAMSSWLVYGLCIRNKVIVIANIVGVLGALLVLFGIWLYR